MKKVCEMKISVCWMALGVGLLLGCKAEPAPEDQGSENPVIENILARKSVREYTSRPIEQEKIDLLLRSGMAAPSGSDKRPWAFVVLQDRARLDTLAAELPYAKMLTQAQAAIVVCGDTLASKLWREDCCAATENILLAAESMGLGAVWTAALPGTGGGRAEADRAARAHRPLVRHPDGLSSGRVDAQGQVRRLEDPLWAVVRTFSAKTK